MSETEIDFGRPIPLFPLAQCVLLPHATVPLHIFEMRYRQMTREAVDSYGLIAMATFAGNDWKSEYNDNPQVRPIVCVGYIAQHELLPDGRYNILLQGLCRAKIVDEKQHEPYRMGLLEPTEINIPMEIDLGDHRRRLESLFSDSLLKRLATISTINKWLSKEIPTSAVVDLAALTVCGNVEQRYTMLAEPSIHARAQWLQRYLEDTRQTLAAAERIGCVKTDEGWILN